MEDPIDTEERLQRVLAARGVASRRRAEEMIRAGRVSVDGQVVSELGYRVDPRTAVIAVDGQPLRPQRLRYVLLNKPSGYITTTSDERGRRTVMDLVPTKERIYPVGRLDRDTEGLLLLTNDGDVAHRVMHPRHQLAKEYHVVTLIRPSEATANRLRAGVLIEGRRIVPDEFRILRETREGIVLKIVIHEGMYHAVRRMMDAVGISVASLRRVRLGPLAVAGLPSGAWRDLTEGERTTLFEVLRLRDESPPVAPRGVLPRSTPRAGRRRSARVPSQQPPPLAAGRTTPVVSTTSPQEAAGSRGTPPGTKGQEKRTARPAGPGGEGRAPRGPSSAAPGDRRNGAPSRRHRKQLGDGDASSRSGTGEAGKRRPTAPGKPTGGGRSARNAQGEDAGSGKGARRRPAGHRTGSHGVDKSAAAPKRTKRGKNDDDLQDRNTARPRSGKEQRDGLAKPRSDAPGRRPKRGSRRDAGRDDRRRQDGRDDA